MEISDTTSDERRTTFCRLPVKKHQPIIHPKLLSESKTQSVLNQHKPDTAVCCLDDKTKCTEKPTRQTCYDYFSNRCAVDWDGKCNKYVQNISTLNELKSFAENVLEKTFCQLSADSQCSISCENFNPIAAYSAQVCRQNGEEPIDNSTKFSPDYLKTPNLHQACKMQCSAKADIMNSHLDLLDLLQEHRWGRNQLKHILLSSSADEIVNMKHTYVQQLWVEFESELRQKDVPLVDSQKSNESIFKSISNPIAAVVNAYHRQGPYNKATILLLFFIIFLIIVLLTALCTGNDTILHKYFNSSKRTIKLFESKKRTMLSSSAQK